MANDKNNWYHSALSVIADVANKYIRAFKKNGFLFSFGVMIVFVLVYTLIINPVRVDKIIEKRFITEKEKTIEANELAMQRRLQADEILGQIMTKLIDKFPEVQRILLLEGHNGTKTFGNADLIFMTATMEMLTPSSNELEYVSDNLQRQIKQNLLGQFNNTLKHRDYVYYNDISNCHHNDHRLFRKLKAVGDKEALLFGYKDKNNIVQIVLVITGVNLPVNAITEYVADFKPQISNCLM